MSLPAETQKQLVNALPGLEGAEMLRPGYAVEYDFVQPTELRSSLETHRLPGLFFAGQINGTQATKRRPGRACSPASTRLFALRVARPSSRARRGLPRHHGR